MNTHNYCKHIKRYMKAIVDLKSVSVDLDPQEVLLESTPFKLVHVSQKQTVIFGYL